MFTIQRGNPVSKEIRITYSDGTAFDLTDYTIFFTAKGSTDNSDNDNKAVIKKDITSHTTPVSGISLLTLTAAQTLIAEGEYKCDFKIYNSAGVNVNTARDILKVERNVTERTA
jgi:hypothetical protein